MPCTGLIALALCLLFSACVSLPENFEREQSWKLDGSDSRVAAILEDGLAAHPGLSGAYPLGNGMEALAARVVLARAAEQSLDIQYYIWHGDIAGRLLLKELLDAADRGVRIRLLLDDLGVGAANDEGFLLLESHPQVSVHLFNPIALRGARTAGMLADPARINQRMHNKSRRLGSGLASSLLPQAQCRWPFVSIVLAYSSGGYSYQELGDYIGSHITRIGKIVRGSK